MVRTSSYIKSMCHLSIHGINLIDLWASFSILNSRLAISKWLISLGRKVAYIQCNIILKVLQIILKRNFSWCYSKFFRSCYCPNWLYKYFSGRYFFAYVEGGGNSWPNIPFKPYVYVNVIEHYIASWAKCAILLPYKCTTYNFMILKRN